eukprot:5073692-Prymnesium_polylepis.1
MTCTTALRSSVAPCRCIVREIPFGKVTSRKACRSVFSRAPMLRMRRLRVRWISSTRKPADASHMLDYVALVSHALRGRLETLDVARQRKLTPPLRIVLDPIFSRGARPTSRTHWVRRPLSVLGPDRRDLRGDESLGADDRARDDLSHAVSPTQQQHADVVPIERVRAHIGEEECALLTFLPGHGVRDGVEQRTLLGEGVEVVLCVAALAWRLHQVRGSADEFQLGDAAHIEKVAERE